MWWNISLYKNCSRRMIKNDTAILTSRNLIVRFRILLIKFSRVTPCTCCLYEVFRTSIGKLRQNSQRKILYIVSCFTNACPFRNAIPRKFNSFFFFFFFFGRPCTRRTTTLWSVNHSKESSEIFNNAKNFAWDASTTRKFLTGIFAQRTTDFDNEFSP